MRILSFGGGLDSVAIFCLMLQGKIERVDYVVFANTGEYPENPETGAYIENHIRPLCDKHNIPFIEVQKKDRKGNKIDLLSYALNQKKSFPIVQYLSGGSPSNRTCTQDWKVKPIDKFLGNGEHTVLIGFSASEKRRLKDRPNPQVSKNGKLIKYFEYPLIDLGITKDKEIQIIVEFGLPIPEKSASWFGPFGIRHKVNRAKNKRQWDYLQNWIILETIINKKRERIGRDKMYFYPITRGKMTTLYNAVIGATQLELFEELCDSGYCGL